MDPGPRVGMCRILFRRSRTVTELPEVAGGVVRGFVGEFDRERNLARVLVLVDACNRFFRVDGDRHTLAIASTIIGYRQRHRKCASCCELMNRVLLSGGRAVTEIPCPRTAPVDASVNATARGTVPEVLFAEKPATGGGIVTRICISLLDVPSGLVAVRVTVYEPGLMNVWDGFWRVDVAPSPKAHDNDAAPVDASMDWM